MTVRNGMYGQAHHMTTGTSPAPDSSREGPSGDGLSDLRRARSDHRSQDTLGRHEITRPKTLCPQRRLQYGDYLARTATAFAL